MRKWWVGNIFTSFVGEVRGSSVKGYMLVTKGFTDVDEDAVR